MKHEVREGKLETEVQQGLFDITDEVKRFVKDTGLSEGQIVVQSMHATTAIYVNEPEIRLYEDLVAHLSEQAPQTRGRYRHDDIGQRRDCPPDEPMNAHAHLKSALYGQASVPLILHEGEVQLGRYQHIFFAEFDGPCPRKHKTERKYLVSVLGE